MVQRVLLSFAFLAVCGGCIEPLAQDGVQIRLSQAEFTQRRADAIAAIENAGRFADHYDDPVKVRLNDAVWHLPPKGLVLKLREVSDGDRVANAFRFLPEVTALSFKSGEIGELPIDRLHALTSLRSLHFPVLVDRRYTLNMEHFAGISRIATLERLDLGNCSAKSEAFEPLAKNMRLDTVTLNGSLSPRVFIHLSRLKSLKHIMLEEVGGRNQPFSRPIDAQIREAIGKLDGTLQSISLEGLIHVSFIRALAQVRSLRRLYVENSVVDLRPEDVEAFRGHCFLTDFELRTNNVNDPNERVMCKRIVREVVEFAKRNRRPQAQL